MQIHHNKFRIYFILSVLLISQSADAALCPDGTYVSGDTSLAEWELSLYNTADPAYPS